MFNFQLKTLLKVRNPSNIFQKKKRTKAGRYRTVLF